ncbi:hypothetical protein F4778DRAFT_91743 [Xylariomycetidae sp. FL2044]|nr:hypothetical protein F4778DRAFT_91743 [Xylariomycetidae sp. FL2044]
MSSYDQIDAPEFVPAKPMPPTRDDTRLYADGDDDTITTMTGQERDVDSLSINSLASTVSTPDAAGRKLMTVEDPATTVYEAWELISSGDITDSFTWKQFCGIRFGTKWYTHRNGFLDLHPVICFEQGELADLCADAVKEYDAKNSKKNQGRSYAQDIANRAFELVPDVYNKIQDLMEDKRAATNRNPFYKRDWRLVVLEECEYQMTELLPERKKKGIFRRKRPDPAMRRWFLVFRGEVVKSTKEADGWRFFERVNNPWWKVDTRATRASRRVHAQQRKHFEREEARTRAKNAPLRAPSGQPRRVPARN